MRKENQIRRELKHQMELLNKAKSEKERDHYKSLIQALEWVLEM